jgi:hypothetical protein
MIRAANLFLVTCPHIQLVVIFGHTQVGKASLSDRAGLMRQYQELNDVLLNELGIQPFASTKNLYDRLLLGMEG